MSRMIHISVMIALCASASLARTVDDALNTRPEADDRAVIDALAKRAAGGWVANGEIRGKLLFEETVKDLDSVKARWDANWNADPVRVAVADVGHGRRCIRLFPDGKNFINLTQKRSAFIPLKKNRPVSILWEARTPEGGATPYFRYDIYDADYRHLSAKEFRSVVDPTEPQAFHRNSFVYMPSQDGHLMIFFHMNAPDPKPAEVANIRVCDLGDIVEKGMAQGADVRIERERAGDRLLWYVDDTLSSSYPVMPVGTRVPGLAGGTLKIRDCAGEKTRATVVLWSAAARKDLTVEFTDFKSGLLGLGRRLPQTVASAKIVKCHYQGMGAPFIDCITGEGQVLVPELLLNDDSLVVPDHETHRNFVRYSWKGDTRYVDINSVTNSRWGAFIATKDMPISDAPALRPFNLDAGLNKQLALRFTLPNDAVPGKYRGAMRILCDGKTLAKVPVEIEVLPFLLPENAETVYSPSNSYTMGLYTWTVMGDSPEGSMHPFARSPEQVERVYSLLYDNGVRNPAFIWSKNVIFNDAVFRRYLSMIRKIGFPNPLVLGSSGHIGNSTNAQELTAMQGRIGKAIATAAEFGYGDVYFYGFDEAYGEKLLSQRQAWKAARDVGAKVVVSGGNGHFESVGDLLDLCVYHDAPENAKPSDWHSVGHRIWKYGTPQTGPEDPKLFRRNYGLYLWSLGFDGANTYCETDADGVWNDISAYQRACAAGKGGGCYRSHSVLYPTVDGAIETLALTGLESAIKDIRYMTKFRQLLRAKPDAEAKRWFDATDFSSTDPATIRRETIDWILRLQRR